MYHIVKDGVIKVPGPFGLLIEPMISFKQFKYFFIEKFNEMTTSL